MRNKILTKFLILLIGLFLFSTIIPAQFRTTTPIKKGPDLQIKIACPSPAKAYAGQSLGTSIKVWVRNVGDTPPGKYYLGAVVDPGNKVKEFNEGNNTAICRLIIYKQGSTAQKLPDLIVKNIKLVNDCKIAVTVANIGNAGVPADKYVLPNAVGIQMYNGSKPWGGLILSGFDPAGKLKNPGGVATYIWFPGAANLNLKPGWNTLKVIADNNKNLTELKEDNNTLTKRVYCKKTADTAEIKIPKRFFLDFNDAYLVYQPSTKTLQIAAQSNVLSYGSDWQKAKIYPYLYDLKEKFWKGFYWQVNTSRKEVYRVRGGTFGKISPGKKEKLTNVTVDVVGNSNNPTRFFLRFKTAYLVYVPKTKTIQIITEGNVLSYGSDWQKCNLKPYLYHLKQNVWKGFYWKVNTSRKQVYRITGGIFCKISPGSSAVLNIGVRVVE